MSAKILVVEDNADARELMVYALGVEGFTISSAENGYRAIEQAKVEHPDLIITDINMPDMDGIEMIKILRSQPPLNKIPVLVISAYQSGIVKEALKAGANAAMIKPIEFTALLELIRSLLPANGYPDF